MSNKPMSVQKNLADYLLKIFPQLKFLKRTIVTSKLEKATGDQPAGEICGGDGGGFKLFCKSASQVLWNGKQETQQELLRKVIDFDIKLSELCKRK
jgi:hypothetical protein